MIEGKSNPIKKYPQEDQYIGGENIIKYLE
jgi:hypothetical protein